MRRFVAVALVLAVMASTPVRATAAVVATAAPAAVHPDSLARPAPAPVVAATDSLPAPLATTRADSLAAHIDALEARVAALAPTTGRVLAELLAAARELLADDDPDAAAIVLEDARTIAAAEPSR
jgi:hypothetical protein